MHPFPAQNHVKNPATSAPADPQPEQGFHISDQPIVRSNRVPASPDGSVFHELPASYDKDLLYVIARDPKSLFVYWDLNWKRLFARAGLSPRQVHLRIYREDGSIEGTCEINPFRGHCYAEVASAGAEYYCEIGCFEDDEWTSLVRSGKAATPQDRISEDLSAQFATLPIHLSFQRLLDLVGATQPESATLARSVAALQESGRVIPGGTTPDEWSRLVATAVSLNGNGAPVADVVALLKAARATVPTAEELAQWRRLAEQFGGSSWGGASGSGFGGSSPA
jgi:hypothetical protein